MSARRRRPDPSPEDLVGAVALFGLACEVFEVELPEDLAHACAAARRVTFRRLEAEVAAQVRPAESPAG